MVLNSDAEGDVSFVMWQKTFHHLSSFAIISNQIYISR